MIQSISSGKVTKTNNYADYSNLNQKQSKQISFTGINASKIGKELTSDAGSKLGKKVARFSEELADSVKGVFRKLKGKDELPITEKPKILPVKDPYTTHVHDKCVRWNSKHPSDSVSVPPYGCDISVAQAAETDLNSKIRKIDPSFTGNEHHDIQAQIHRIENSPWLTPEEKEQEIKEIQHNQAHENLITNHEDANSPAFNGDSGPEEHKGFLGKLLDSVLGDNHENGHKGEHFINDLNDHHPPTPDDFN